MKKTIDYELLSDEEKLLLAKELFDYHDQMFQNDLKVYYAEVWNIGHRTFVEQLSGRRTMRPKQFTFVVDYLIGRTSERPIREIFKRLFDATPEAYGYLLTPTEPLPFDDAKPLTSVII